MTAPIHPDAIRAFRERKRWTQEQLAKAAKVSLPTIKRIEGKKDGMYAANTKKAEAISKALGVTLADLAAAPADDDHDEQLRKFGYRPLRTMVDAETALAFNMVQHIYGIPIKSQIVMAPLFMAILAEGSLAWRRKRVAEIEEAAGDLHVLAGGHLSFAHVAYRAEDGAAAERQSIEMKDLFGEHVCDEAFEFGYDPSVNNPFADYLVDFARKTAARTVTFEEGAGWKTSEGFPNYTIGADLIADITAGDLDAEYALMRGHVYVDTVPPDLVGADRDADRVAWMIAQIPAEEMAKKAEEMAKKKAEREAFLARFGPDFLSDLVTSAVTAKGDQDA